MAGRRVIKVTEVVKTDNELGILWGYASVADVVDLQGDLVPQDELVRAVYDFMVAYYQDLATILENHAEPPDVILVESTFHYLACKLRWYVGVKLMTEELRAAARDGEISGFSIGGVANEIPEEAAA